MSELLPVPSLAALAEELLAAGSSRILLQGLEHRLQAARACPARLHLADLRAGTFYPVAGFGCEAGTAELSIPAAIDDPRHHLLANGAETVGMLALPHGAVAPAGLIDLLGPALVALQRHEEVVGQLRSTHEQMNHLVSAGRLLRLLDLDVLLVEIVQSVLKAAEAQVAAVLTPGAEGQPLAIRIAWGLREDHVAAIRLKDGRRLADAVHADGQLLRLSQEEIAERLDLSALDARLTGVLCLPLTVSDRKLGVVLLANPDGDFGADSQRVAQTVCDLAAMALDNAQLVLARVQQERLARELDLAREVQANMFPPPTLAVGVLTVAGSFRSADETGGDYYTYQERKGRLAAMIADVTGHGLGAALFTTAAHAIIQQQLATGADLVETMRNLNAGLFLTRSGRFMTAALLEIEPDTRRLRYYSAGHNPLLWIHQGTVRWLDSHGMPLGILEELMDPEAGGADLAPGDTLVLYTDGFTEAANPTGELWGEERFAAAVQAGLAGSGDPTALVAHLFTAVDAWAAGTRQADDLTLAVIRVG